MWGAKMKKSGIAYIIILFLTIISNYKKEREIFRFRKEAEKTLHEKKVFEQWLFVKQDNKHISDYFHKKGINTIAIYGMGDMGERLLDEMRNENIVVEYAIDQKGSRICSDIEIIADPDVGMLKKVDAIVVTTFNYFDDIRDRLLAKVDIPIFSLEEILYEI